MRKVPVKVQAELPRLLTFFQSKEESRRGEEKDPLLRLNRLDRYLKLIKHNSDVWLRKRGKSLYMGFTSSQKQQIKAFFDSLDTEKTGGVTIQELLEPLLSLGLVHSKEDVQRLFPSSDQVIDFDEFLSILEREKITDSTISKMTRMMIQPSPLPHKVRISSNRRKLMMDAYVGNNAKKRENGLVYLKLFAQERCTARENVEKKDVLVKKKMQRLGSLRQISPNRSVRQLHSVSTSRKSPYPVSTRKEKLGNLSSFL